MSVNDLSMVVSFKDVNETSDSCTSFCMLFIDDLTDFGLVFPEGKLALIAVFETGVILREDECADDGAFNISLLFFDELTEEADPEV